LCSRSIRLSPSSLHSLFMNYSWIRKGYAAAHSWAPYEGLDQRLALDTWPSVRAGTAWPFPPAVVGHQAALRWPFPVESAGRFERAAAFFADAGGVSGV